MCLMTNMYSNPHYAPLYPTTPCAGGKIRDLTMRYASEHDLQSVYQHSIVVAYLII